MVEFSHEGIQIEISNGLGFWIAQRTGGLCEQILNNGRVRPCDLLGVIFGDRFRGTVGQGTVQNGRQNVPILRIGQSGSHGTDVQSWGDFRKSKRPESSS